MADFDRFSSPDPLTLPSSPLAAHSKRSPSRPISQRSVNLTSNSSPAKSFIMETGKADDGSPWRIKVTVEAEPKVVTGSNSSVKKATRTTRVPLKSTCSPSNSPAKKPARRGTPTRGASEEGQQPKMKATPRQPTRRAKAAPNVSEPAADEDDAPAAVAALMPPSSSPTQHRSSSARSKKRTTFTPLPTQRFKRLSQAREQLDQALHDAVGYSDEGDSGSEHHHVPGDMTVAGEEDFTMVSVETLESFKADTSRVSVGEKSRLSVSYLPSSPPPKPSSGDEQEVEEDLGEEDLGEEEEKGVNEEKGEGGHRAVAYPNLSDEASSARMSSKGEAAETNVYDEMSWKATGAPLIATPNQQPTQDQVRTSLNSEPREWRKHREAVSREIDNANPGEVIVIEDDAGDDADAGQDEDGDIWQEEASRSVEEDQPQPAERSPQLDDLFAGQAEKPRRSKIPRTWRRTSGNEFSYVDSPDRETLQRKISDAESRSSAVLTPPSTDDEVGKSLEVENDEGKVLRERYEEDDTSFTHPDAAATQFQIEDRADMTSQAVDQEVTSPISDSSESVTSPDGEDTGLFWQSNLPNVYRQPRPRPRRQRAMDLSELLNLNQSSPAKGTSADAQRRFAGSSRTKPPMLSTTAQTRYSPVRMRPVEGKIKSSPSDASRSKMISSPLRRSLLRSSKVQGSPVGKAKGRVVKEQMHSHKQQSMRSEELAEDASEALDTSFQSKASDQRQLLAEMDEADQHHAYEDDGDEEEENARSYEEQLNLASPQKVKVNFNDSAGNASLLAPTRQYPPLFTDAAVQQQRPAHAAPPSTTLVANTQPPATVTQVSILETQSQQSIFTRLTTSFWSAVVRPTGPTEVLPPPPLPPYCPALRFELRSRYGVLSSSLPWTILHMRILHRMVNSCTSNKSDSIVPKTGPLPPFLAALVGKQHASIDNYPFLFTSQLAHVVDALMQVLVPAHVDEAMRRGEVEMLGDSGARAYRGMLAGRHGDDLVYDDIPGVPMRGEITMDFVARAVGDVVKANVITDAKDREARRRQEGL